jgi:inorganic triphosphatase YgiF
LYVFCGDPLLVAKLRTADRDASDGSVETLAFLVEQIRKRWPKVRILFRGDSGFARDDLMTWCEDNAVYFVLGLAKNKRLLQKIGNEVVEARALFDATQHASRVFTHFQWSTQKSWTRPRRVIAKAEHLAKGANPRFIVTNLDPTYAPPKALYENVYCARGEMENRIKEQQLDLFADRTSTHTLRANQLRLWFASVAYVLVSALRRTALHGTRMARSTCGSIRLKLFKIGAQIKISVRRVVIHFASACPHHDVFQQALRNLSPYPLRC